MEAVTGRRPGDRAGMNVAGVIEAVSREEIVAVDRELVRLARGRGRLRMLIGEGLDRLITASGPSRLGFSDVKAYAVERCERTKGWVGESRTLARRLRKLPRISEALKQGRICWSMAVLLAKHAMADN